MVMAQVLKVTHEVIDVGRETNIAMHQIENHLGDLTRNQAREGFQEWLSPPDPTINYNTARKAYHDGTATWFTRSEIFERWKESGSEHFLWIHGKPGSGKSILSSAIIHDTRVSNPGAPRVIYFFFDFKDEGKQDTRALLSSLLVQLCDQFDSSFKVLFNMYSSHKRGKQQPSEDALSQCLKDMLLSAGQSPIYLIVDALDESPDTSKVLGAPPSRRMVLDVVKELVELRLSNLHICVTSRPEADIRSVLEPLARFKMSLHDQDGQKEDIANYVHSVIYSDKEQGMKRWRQDVKDLVIKTLSEKANGMFRWVICQLELLRKCPTRNVLGVLNKLPKSLDETYLRVLKGVDEESREDVYRLLQCLVVSIRPLRVEELAEVLAVDFDNAEGIPKLNPDWRWGDQEQSLQAACSSLIAIVDTGHSRVVQFSHFSVKEFLTSDRLADSSEDVSRYYVSLEPAHLILAQACLGALLHLDDGVDVDVVDEISRSEDTRDEDTQDEDTPGQDENTQDEDSSMSSFDLPRYGSQQRLAAGSPLAGYAAKHWVAHAQFENVSSCIRKAMEDLFDPNKSNFSAWLQLHDIDTGPSYDSAFYPFFVPNKSEGTPLYYATLCGFHDLAEHLIVRHPQYIDARGGHYVTPLVGALAGNHFQIAQLLHQRGADVDVRGDGDVTPLISASTRGHPEFVQWLLSHGADVNSQDEDGDTSLRCASTNLEHPDVARILVEHNADPNAPNRRGYTPLHYASANGHLDMVRLLLELGVDVNTRAKDGKTPLHRASEREDLEVARVLLEHGADVEAEDDKGKTAFQLASEGGRGEVMKLLSEHGAKHGGSSES
ncbi:hypothetical protein BJV78DRAFT_681434 [Lactifluus subvellereus]|nr:hypothetical protein BJV78DRAFT_681434 [Lactifluus subvellereus]